MNNTQGLLRRQAQRRGSEFMTGSLLGLGAAMVGMSPLVAGLRPWHILVVVAFMLVLSQRGIDSLARLKITTIDILFILFIALSAIVEYVNAGQLNYEPELVSVFTDLFYVLAYLTGRLVITSTDSFSRLLRGVIWPAIPMSLLGVLQAVGVEPVIRLTLMLAPTEAVGNRLERGDSLRAWGLTGHWTGFGGYLTCVIAALMCLMIIEHQSRCRVRKDDVLRLGILFTGVLATLTFSVLLSAMAIILVSWRRLKVGVNGVLSIVLLAIFGALTLGPFLAGRFDQQFAAGVSAQDLPPWLPSTLAYRFVIWERETLPALFERPFLGWGAGAYDGDVIGRQYPIQLDWLSAESQWLSMAIGYGILVALVFGLLIVLIGLTFIRARKGAARVFLEPLVTMWIALFLTSFTVAVFTNRGTPSVLYILLGCAVALQQLEAPKSSLGNLKTQEDLLNLGLPRRVSRA